MDAEKKNLISEYKQEEQTGGIYGIRNVETGRLFIDGSKNIKGSQGRFDFAQKTGSCVIPKLKKDWDQYGKEAFTFEVFETLKKKEDQSLKTFYEDLKLLKELWLEKMDQEELY